MTSQCGVEAARPDQQFDQPRIGFRCRKWIGAIDPHRDRPPGTAQLYRYRQDLGFVVRRAQRWRSDIDISCHIYDGPPCNGEAVLDHSSTFLSQFSIYRHAVTGATW